jgi:hypothetical protein
MTLSRSELEDSELEELVIPIWHKELKGLRSHVVLRLSMTGTDIGFYERVTPAQD